jgi:glycosyltransferase involved in cell wall biosynthesis
MAPSSEPLPESSAMNGHERVVREHTRVSVVTIARNEEQDLPGFLDSFLPWAHEVVIVDDGSTDRTCEIAERGGPRVKLLRSPRAPGEGFCHQRNKGGAAATGDWLLHVDVDMRAPRPLVREIAAAVRAESLDAYEFGIVHFFMNRRLRFSGAQSWRKTWLVRNGFGRFEGVVHERLELRASARVGRLRERMWHLGDGDFSERLRKNVLYSELEAQRLLESGGHATLAGSCWSSAKAFVRTYFWQLGICDGRLGLFWALYVWSSTMNRSLLAYERVHPASRAELERRVQEEGM